MAPIEQFPAKHGARFSIRRAQQWISRSLKTRPPRLSNFSWRSVSLPADGSQRSDGGKSRALSRPAQPYWLLRLRGVSGTLSLSGALMRATGEESMSGDPDYPKANHARQVLRQARLSRNEAAAIMVGDLVYETASTGFAEPEIEEARQAAWVAISALAKTLQAEGFAPPALWKAAVGATESWIELLDH